jgi:DNA (cytosine-5)-methyltransferase 1
MAAFKFIDLFAGIGGFHHALGQLGGECVLTCELDPECKTVYLRQFPEFSEDHFVENIRQITRHDVDDEDSSKSQEEISELVPDHDVLCGGFPCQPFSKSGFQKGIRDQTRGTLFFDIMEIVRAKRPRYCILENVRNLAGPRHTETWQIIISSLRNEGYEVSDVPLVLSPHLVPKEYGGAPQVRDRVFILATRSDVPKSSQISKLSRSTFSDWNPDRWSIADYLQDDHSICDVEKYQLSQSEKSWVDCWNYLVKHLDDDSLPGFPIWADALLAKPELDSSTPAWMAAILAKNSSFYLLHKDFLDNWMSMQWGNSGTVLDFPPSRFKFEWQARKHFPTSEGRDLESLVMQMRPSGIRVKPPSYLPALVAITQTSIIGPKVKPGILDYRKITPCEAAKLQAMPDKFCASIESDKSAYKQLGNAVNVGIVGLVFQVMAGENLLSKPLTLPSKTVQMSL